ncbi:MULTISPECIES: LysR family transcriptional regulator [Bradyrhizobium]|uniref:LysR family transcriptional regulator n=1 Tax=Bradyrhizobium TaxID=374 RepID=UPI000556F90C|nr:MULTISPECIES: LysR family transcriptional regulator [unclassified Bradyrhizobium]MDA9424571.1 LysR family transcriptional regulator [Bradyrhizobium sp. CCBAU 53380]MDA9465162.1 LysR family transcriptional regulator [Bradyrhizobium sp. CCBAU 53415]
MDRLDAMKVFVLAVDEGSLAAAGRKLGRSPAAVSRAIAFLEERVGAELLHRTTRSIKLSEDGERYVEVCRRVLTELEEAEDIATAARAAPRGILTITAPVVSGEMVLRPILDAFLDAYPAVSAKLLLFDRPVNLVEEGVDVALRIGPLVDSTMIAMRVGEINRVVVAAPRYLKQHPRIAEPSDLAKHQIVAMAHLPNSWTFAAQAGSSAPRTVQFNPRLIVNSTYAAVASAVAGRGVARMYSYQVAEPLARGDLEIVLADQEDPQMPAHLICPQGRLSVPKVRAFTDFAVPRLKKQFASLKRSTTAR